MPADTTETVAEHSARLQTSINLHAPVTVLIADVPGDWRRPQGRPRSSWLRTVLDDLVLIDTSPLQSAYCKFHSTETALLKLTNDIMETIDSGKLQFSLLCICLPPLILYTTLHFFIDFSILLVCLVMLSPGFVHILPTAHPL